MYADKYRVSYMTQSNIINMMIGMTIKEFLDKLRDVREQSLMEGRNLLEQAHEIYLKWFYWSALFAEVFQNTDWESYTVQFYMESIRIMESSLVLAIHGEYRSAIQVLRDWLEGIVGGIYFDSCPEEGKRWEKGELIDFGKSKKTIVDNTLRVQVGRLWGEFSKYVHQKPEASDFSSGGPFAAYDEEKLEQWVIFLKRTFETCNSLLVYKFPQLRAVKEIEAIMGKMPA